MEIRKRRIRTLESNLPSSLWENDLVVAQAINDESLAAFRRIGFEEDSFAGTTILPLPVGPVTLFNAEGRYIPQRDKPKETAFRQVEWTHTEWHGQEKVEVTSTVDIPYQRYPRKFLPPPSIEVSVVQRANSKILVSPVLRYDTDGYFIIKHTINMFLEIFKSCEVLNEDLGSVIPPITERSNWIILPPGEYPWDRAESIIRHNLSIRRRERQVIISRLNHIASMSPDFVATGNGGFAGYVVFGFNDKKIYILENPFSDNATYVLGEDWESLSQMTKAQLLDQGLHKDRIIHREGWPERIRRLVG